MSSKRKEYLNWEEYFMGCAILSSMRSKDPSNQVGACIVNEDTKKILSIGYNGLTCGMNDDQFDWESSGEKTGILKNVKDFYIVHAERNAILNYSGNTKDLRGATLYMTWFPCTECTKEIIQVGIKKIVYLRMFSKLEQVEISKIMLNAAGIEVVAYNNRENMPKEEIHEITNKIQKMFKELSDD